MIKIVNSLTKHLKERKMKDPKGHAIAFLKVVGILDNRGQLTAKGKVRNAMTSEQRAKSRASKISGKPPIAYRYDKKKQRAVLK